MYLVAVQGLGLPPSEFWNMTVAEFMVLFQHHVDNAPGNHAGKLTNRDVDELSAWMGSEEYLNGAA